MKTSTADNRQYVCPLCRDDLTTDLAGRGFVRHKHNPDCDFERGERDLYGPYGLFGPFGQKSLWSAAGANPLKPVHSG